ncbi:MAG: hypothetical protein F4187_08470 [Gemmatimonadetes bacterium]|nr:hypothetical protein [Gemmatimonadota bacterium]
MVRRLHACMLAATAASAALLGGCALTEVTLTESEDVVIVESQLTVNLENDGTTELFLYAYLHRTLSAGRPDEVEGAAVRVSGESGTVVRLAEADSGGVCLTRDRFSSDNSVGSCYVASVSPSPFSPREVVELEVILADGGRLSGVSRIPDAFDFVGLAQEDGRCRVEPDTNYRFNWTEAAGTWSYLSDTWILGLDQALIGPDLPPGPDSLYLSGFAIGEKDTDILFPGEYGLFNFDSEEESITDLLRVLDDGLPGGSWAEVAFAATDRNWVNWVRGGNFNPSGIIRIPSVFGDGTGFFGTATQRVVNVIAQPGSEGAPPLCGPGAATPP